MDKINASDKIMFEIRKKGENMEVKELLHKSPSNILYRYIVHSLLRRANSRGSADIIYHI